jgi:hypothetical protein
MKYRKKPGVIEARRWVAGMSDGYLQDMHDWLGAAWHSPASFGGCRITTLHGPVEVEDGDWIIKGAKGDFWPCKPDIFEATYEPVDDEQEGDR